MRADRTRMPIYGGASAGRQARERDLRDVKRKISNIVDALAEGTRPGAEAHRQQLLDPPHG